MRTEAARVPGRSRRGLPGLAPSARALARTVAQMATTHADRHDIVAVCEKWAPRLAALEREAHALLRTSGIHPDPKERT